MAACDHSMEEGLLGFNCIYTTGFRHDERWQSQPTDSSIPSTLKSQKSTWSNIRAGWLMFSTHSTAQKFIIQIILIGKCFSSYIGEISNYSQQWLDVWENPDKRTFFLVKELSQLLCSKKQTKKKSSTKLTNCFKIRTNQIKYYYFCCFEIIMCPLKIAGIAYR